MMSCEEPSLALVAECGMLGEMGRTFYGSFLADLQ